jgi:predicted transcriptional regulator of viral defense system
MKQKLILGDKENRLLLTLEENKKEIFTFQDAQKILQSSNSSVKNILYNLNNKNCIQRIEKGKYLLVPAKAGYDKKWTEEPWIIIPHLIKEYYVGFWTAMNYWGMTEQIPNTFFVVTTKRKRKLKFGYQKFQFVRFPRSKFFGYTEEVRGKTKFNISTREKTIIDGLMHPEYSGGVSEVAKAIWNSRKELNWKLLYEMARKTKKSVILRRLGYLITILEIKDDTNSIIDLIKKESFKGYRFLDSTESKKISEYSKKYGLMINRTKNDLLAWMKY